MFSFFCVCGPVTSGPRTSTGPRPRGLEKIEKEKKRNKKKCFCNQSKLILKIHEYIVKSKLNQILNLSLRS